MLGDIELIKIISMTDNATIKEMMKSGKMESFIRTHKQEICRNKLGSAEWDRYKGSGLDACTMYTVRNIHPFVVICYEHPNINALVKYAILKGLDKESALLTLITHNGIRHNGTRDVDIARFLLDHGADATDRELLIRSCQKGDLEIVKLLFEYGADSIRNSRMMSVAVSNGHLNLVKFLLSKGYILESNYLHLAAVNGELEIVKYFVKMGVNLHIHGGQALALAYENDYLDIVNYLVSKGVYVDL